MSKFAKTQQRSDITVGGAIYANSVGASKRRGSTETEYLRRLFLHSDEHLPFDRRWKVSLCCHRITGSFLRRLSLSMELLEQFWHPTKYVFLFTVKCRCSFKTLRCYLLSLLLGLDLCGYILNYQEVCTEQLRLANQRSLFGTSYTVHFLVT